MRMTMGRRAYPSDLTDAQWEMLASLIPEPSLEGRPPILSRREIVNGILYVLRSGWTFRLLPHEFPAWQSVYYYFRRWDRQGVWDRILETLRMQVRQRQGREAQRSRCRDRQSIHQNQCGSWSSKGLRTGEKRVMPQSGTIRDERGYTGAEGG